MNLNFCFLQYRFLLTAVFLSVAFPPAIAQFNITWQKNVTGNILGHAGILPIDLDGDGKEELITDALIKDGYGSHFWSVLEQRADTLSVEQTWYSDQILWACERIQLAPQPDGSGHYLLLALYNPYNPVGERRVQWYDLETRAFVQEIELPLSTKMWALDDYDANGALEFILFTETGVQVWDYATLQPKNSWPGSTFFFFPKIGNFDADPQKEFFSAGYYEITVQKVVNGHLETVWSKGGWPTGPSDVDFYDLDNDGDLEVLALFPNDSLVAFDPSKNVQLWKLDLGQYGVQHFVLHDLTGDNKPEIIFAGFSSIVVVRTDNLSVIKTIQKTFTNTIDFEYTSDFAIADTDGNGIGELVWADGFGYSSPPPSRIYLQELTGQQRSWISTQEAQDLFYLDCADFLHTGQKQLLQAHGVADPQGLDRGNIAFYDIATKDVLWKSSAEFFGGNFGFPGYFKGLQLDSDPELEIALGLENHIQKFDLPGFQNLVPQYYPFPAVAQFKTFEQADLDQDGMTEIISCLETTGAGGEGASYVVVLDTALQIKWHTPHLETSTPYINNFFLRTGNIDDDPALEIVVLKTNVYWQYSAVLVVDGLTRDYFEFEITNDNLCTGLELADLDGDGRLEILLARNGTIEVWDATAGPGLRWTIPVGTGGSIDNIKALDYDKDGHPEITITHQGRVKVLNPIDGDLYWESRFLGTTLNPLNRLIVAEAAGIPRIFAATAYFLEEYSYTGQLSSIPERPHQHPAPAFTVFPNPSTGQVAMQLKPDTPYLIRISDLSGKLVHRETLRSDYNGWANLNLQNLPGGVYTCQAMEQNGNACLSRTIAIQR